MLVDYTVNRLFGIMPGGGLLNCYLIRPDVVGAAGESAVRAVLDAASDRDRRIALRTVAELLSAHDITHDDETVSAISLGSDELGNRVIVATCLISGGPM